MKYKSKIIGNTTNGFPSINKGTVTKNEEIRCYTSTYLNGNRPI